VTAPPMPIVALASRAAVAGSSGPRIVCAGVDAATTAGLETGATISRHYCAGGLSAPGMAGFIPDGVVPVAGVPVAGLPGTAPDAVPPAGVPIGFPMVPCEPNCPK
jgi:hypothetical protein